MNTLWHSSKFGEHLITCNARHKCHFLHWCQQYDIVLTEWEGWQSKYNIYPAIEGDFQTSLGFPVPLHSILENRLLQCDLLWNSWGDKLPIHSHLDETESIDVMIANTWNTRLFPKPVGSAANTSFSLRRLFIAMSCSFLRWISLEDFEDKNEMALCRRDALPAIALTMLRILSNRWGLFWQVSNELTNQQFTFRFWT